MDRSHSANYRGIGKGRASAAGTQALDQVVADGRQRDWIEFGASGSPIGSAPMTAANSSGSMRRFGLPVSSMCRAGLPVSMISSS